MRRINDALTELNDRQVLLSITKDMLRGPRKRIMDVKDKMMPTIDFIEEMKMSNKRAKKPDFSVSLSGELTTQGNRMRAVKVFEI